MKKFLKNMEETFAGSFLWECKTVVIPLLLVLVVGTIFFLIGKRDVAEMIVIFGSSLVMIGNVFYIIFFHSKKRWEGISWTERAWRLLTFRRDPPRRNQHIKLTSRGDKTVN